MRFSHNLFFQYIIYFMLVWLHFSFLSTAPRSNQALFFLLREKKIWNANRKATFRVLHKGGIPFSLASSTIHIQSFVFLISNTGSIRCPWPSQVVTNSLWRSTTFLLNCFRGIRSQIRNRISIRKWNIIV